MFFLCLNKTLWLDHLTTKTALNVNISFICVEAIISIWFYVYRSVKLLSPEVALYLYKSTINPCMEYCCHIWAVAPSCYLELLEKLQKRICRTVSPSLAAFLEPLIHCQNAVSLSLFYRYLIDVFQNWLSWFHFFFLEGVLFVILTDCMIFLSQFLDVTRMSMSTISFLALLRL